METKEARRIEHFKQGRKEVVAVANTVIPYPNMETNEEFIARGLLYQPLANAAHQIIEHPSVELIEKYK